MRWPAPLLNRSAAVVLSEFIVYYVYVDSYKHTAVLTDVLGSHLIMHRTNWLLGLSPRPHCLTLDLSSSRIQMGALGHTSTPFCSICRQFFGFIPGDVHVVQISSDDVHPIFPWASRLSLVAPQLKFPLCSLTRYSGVIHS